MQEKEFQQWIQDFYKERGWSGYGPFERMVFLTEEVGETARVVRTIEIGRDRPDEAAQPVHVLKQELIEELGDVLANVYILAGLYDLSIEEILRAHKDKLSERYSKE
ncbi:MazG-like family protein [Paenibacillus sp. BK720]|uniref:MazG nucleotide pyrophosphohydrolase domain-containing protein n=1 Tax=Paenibacillus sp. BK720 TaxID=2587092 RepID=UPI00141F3212|nr:MazG-like family protein [Paenibacillus sp. BK720]NIK71329.1 NTP pyrophosphatase (non-canonical NTP hydrolase) [Paenibacillus sp. BK720]